MGVAQGGQAANPEESRTLFQPQEELHRTVCIARTWPGQARTLWGSHQRFIETYYSRFPRLYFTGDGCRRDEDGSCWMTGRVDDVLNVSGHRLGTAEVESALVAHEAVAVAAVVGFPHELKGTGVCAYVTVKPEYQDSEVEQMVGALKEQVRHVIGPIATPDQVRNLWKEPHPVLPGEIERLEADWGVRLPGEYKRLASLYQGMTPVPNSFNVGRSSNALSVLLTVTKEPGHETYSIQHKYELFRPHIPSRLYPFGDTPGGEPICFDYRESLEEPRIVLVSTEAQVHPVADSFQEFLEGLYDD